MTAHEMRTDWDSEACVVRAECSCGGWSGQRDYDGKANTLTRAHAAHRASAVAFEAHEAKRDAQAWYVRTAHCAACGQPGTFCLCRNGCDCSSLHPTGSGVDRDAAEVFATPSAADVPLFDVDGAQ